MYLFVALKSTRLTQTIIIITDSKASRRVDSVGVQHLLESLNLNKYIDIFKQNEVDGRTLQNCHSEEDVKQLGITMTAKARVLLNEIEKLRSLGLPVEHSNKV